MSSAQTFKGHVSFTARVADQHISFPKVSAKAPWPNVESIEIESTQAAEEITGTVYVTGVASESEGVDVATDAVEDALSRLVYAHGVSIEPARTTGSQFEPVAPLPGRGIVCGTGYIQVSAGGSMRAIRGLRSADIQATLEAAPQVGEDHYALYRSARSSSTRFEEFMHLYWMLLQLVGDKQEMVDSFVTKVEPGVAISPGHHGRMETVYTRLRNEVGHRRAGTSMQKTRAEMGANVAGLREIVRAAITAFP